ncbi:MAG: hypothetical protein ACRESZ_03445 [Methylococcales bacterium]
MKHKLISFFLLLVFVVAAYVFLIKGVTPFVEDVVSSDLFLVKSDDPAETFSTVSNEKSRLAALQCNQYLRDNYEGATIGELSDDDYTAWALGNYTYMINTTGTRDGVGVDQSKDKFVCTIHWIEGDPLEYDNWEVTQFEFNKQGE